MSFPGQALQRCWHLVDAKHATVGRLASQVAGLLRGKHKPTFRPNKDMGDSVVIINAEQVHFSGKKWDDKLYRHHTGYPGGLKQRTASQMLSRNPTQILRKAVLGMLSRNKLRHGYIEKRLYIYTGPTHPHTAQLGNAVGSSSIIRNDHAAINTKASNSRANDSESRRTRRIRPQDRLYGSMSSYAHPHTYQASSSKRQHSASKRQQKLQHDAR